MKYAIASLLLLAGCALAPPVPQTPAQTVYAATGVYILVVDTTIELLNKGLITVEQAEEVRGYLNEVHPGIKAAADIVRSGQELPQDTLSWLAAVTGSLSDILLELSHE